jgi:hypothetical protein
MEDDRLAMDLSDLYQMGVTELNEPFVGAFVKLRKATVNFVTSVRPSAWNNLDPTRRIFVTLDVAVFFENPSGKFKFR